MRFGSLFSGIGGFDLGFEQAGLSCEWQVEIDKDCNRVLENRFRDVTKFPDVNDVGKLPTVDVICGGFPCQDLSVAGKRAGLAGERSGLWFQFLRIIESNLPRWIVIENVPGLLSSDEGRDFAAILRGLVECGYVLAWRVADAQYFGVAQRRRRVFIVGSLGNGSCAEILFESDSVPWNPPTRREARPGVTPILEAGARTNGDGYRDGDGIGLESDPMFTLQSGKQHGVAYQCHGSNVGQMGTLRSGNGNESGGVPFVAATLKQRGRGACDEVMDNLQVSMPLKAKANSSHDESHETYVTHALSSEGADASEDGTGRGTPLVVDRLEHRRFHCLNCGQWFGVNDYESNTVTCPKCGETHIDKITDVLDARAVDVRNLRMQPDGTSGTLQHKKSGGYSLNYQNPVLAFDERNITSRENRSNPQPGDPCHTLHADPPTLAFTERTRSEGRTLEAQEELAYAVTNPGSGGRTHSRQIAGGFGVRRLTPTECERLQSFPDGWTAVDIEGKEISDSARYRMLGNAVCVNVARWIGKRLIEVSIR